MSTLTLNLSDREGAVLEQLAGEMDMSKTAVMRQALPAAPTPEQEGTCPTT